MIAFDSNMIIDYTPLPLFFIITYNILEDMNKCLVSIITPAYNCKNTIKETYESIKNQSFNSWEWIIVEDHSTDQSFAYIKEMVQNDSRVIVLRTKTNSGAAVARNVGIERAKGQYIAFLDSDDLWKRDKITHQIDFMKNNGYSFTYTNYDLLYENGSIKKYVPKRDKIDYNTLLKRCDIGCLTVIYDTSALGKVFMPIDCKKREDYGAWLDITKKGVVAYKLNESLSIYRISSTSVSFNKFKMIKYHYNVYRNHEKFGVVKAIWYLFLHSMNKIFAKY